MINAYIKLPKEYLSYAVGSLLYIPAINSEWAKQLLEGDCKDLSSLALCLEDSIRDDYSEFAEQKLIDFFRSFSQSITTKENPIHIPSVFVRIRDAAQMERFFNKLGDNHVHLDGFILPKFSNSNAKAYKEAILRINTISSKTIYVMPTIESPDVLYAETRINTLTDIKKAVDDIKDYVLNIRIGGSDFCQVYGLRRNVNQTIYDVGLINFTMLDILNVFLRDYVVAAPVWEFFKGGYEGWQDGLKRELELDKLNGFIGKTAIHPSQLRTIKEAFMVDENDYVDAKDILNWENHLLGVKNGTMQGRMNELKTHEKWAKKIIALASVYGIKRTEV